MKKILRNLIDFLTAPVFHGLFLVCDIKLLAYFSGFHYGMDVQRPRLSKVVTLVVSRHLKCAGRILNARLRKMSLEDRRRCSELVWAQAPTLGWARRAFEDPEGRSKNYVYEQILALSRKLGRNISILELGCMNGGSLNCLRWMGVGIDRYCGVDLSGEMISEARATFPDPNSRFYQLDFLQYCAEATERFDVLLIKQTFLFLDQPYLEKLLAAIDRRSLADRVVIHELQRPEQVSVVNSMFGNFGNVPQDYSHNYEHQFKKAGYVIESGGLIPHAHHQERNLFHAVLVRNG